MSKKVRRIALPIIGAVLGSTVLPGIGFGISPALGGALGGGAADYAQNKDLKSALFSAGGSYLGGKVLGNLAGNNLGTIGSTLDKVSPTLGLTPANYFTDLGNAALGQQITGGAGNALGQLANTSIASALGSTYGGNVASTLAPASQQAPSGPSPFQPSRQSEQDAPFSIGSLGTLTPGQQSTNIATQGVYGGGAGVDESGYFLNLINRRLIDDQGTLDADLSEINPIEQSYLQSLGLGGYGDTRSLLEAISKWKAQ